jgi:poly(3-hydroxybutyrate) depolymerase
MNPKRLAFTATLFIGLLSIAHAQGPIDTAFEKFWNAKSPADAESQVAAIVKTRVSFDEALRRLKAGRTYRPAEAGVKMVRRDQGGVEYWYAVNVPAGYNPARKYQVRFQLHGGIGARVDNRPRGTGEIGNLAGAEQFYVLPYGSARSPWWGEEQVKNLTAIVDDLKRTYNIDENRVVVAGVSDGGSGLYYLAMREMTQFASFLPLNGFMMVLANNDIDDRQNFPNNLRNRPLFIINGGEDPLYPTSAVEPYIRHLANNGVKVSYHPQPEAGHNTAWWPEMKNTFEKFVADNPRAAHPDTLTWETGNTVHNRIHWLIIDKAGAQPGEMKDMRDPNLMSGFERLFRRLKTPSRVDLTRKGNTVEAQTREVSEFTLLLSPDQFDFNQPLRVVANGREVFNGRVQKSVETLLKWAAKDNDRTMLYAAELKIVLGK